MVLVTGIAPGAARLAAALGVPLGAENRMRPSGRLSLSRAQWLSCVTKPGQITGRPVHGDMPVVGTE